MKKTAVIAGIIAVVTCIMGASAYLILSSDRTGPEIFIEENGNLLYRAGMENSELLDGVKATDKKDGDVTDSLIVESVVVDRAGLSAEVTYVAMDSRHNVTKLKRSLAVADDAGEEDTVEVSLPIEPTPVSQEETNDPEETVSQLPAENPRIRLNEHEVLLPLGSKFNVLKYVEDIQDDDDDRDALYRDIQVSGEVDVNTAGIYELSYYVTDSDGNQSNIEVLKVTVQ